MLFEDGLASAQGGPVETCFSLPRLQVSKTHFRMRGGVLSCLSPSVAGAGPERTLRADTLRIHTSSWSMHTRDGNKLAIPCNTH